MQSSIPKATSKDKQKSKPKIGAGSKDEKRKQKKEKLAETLQKKKEAQQAVFAPPEEPVTFGQSFQDALMQVIQTDTSNTVRKPSQREKLLNAVSGLKQLYANSDFTNPGAVFGDVNTVLNQKSANLQTKNAIEEQKKIEQQRQEKQQSKK